MLKLILILMLIPMAFGFDWQGHRGARGLYPENTIGAMLEALKWPVTTLELDVVISKDKKVVVSHEPWMNPDICTLKGTPAKGKSNNLFKMDYAEIQQWDCGTKAHPRFPRQQKVSVGKPLLSRLIEESEKKLKELNRTDVSYNVEIKSTPAEEKSGHQPSYQEFTDLVVSELKKYLPLKRFTIQSFDWRVLKYIKSKWPEVAVVALRGEKYEVEEVLKELGFNPEVFSPYFKHLTQQQVKRFHALGVKVIPWTVNEVQEMQQLISYNVDGIITDYPDLIPEATAKKCQEGFSLFEGECVKLPKNSLPSGSNPGWVCRPGFMQKRSQCIKIDIPKNAHLLDDGKTWECDEGYERYRSKCRAR